MSRQKRRRTISFYVCRYAPNARFKSKCVWLRGESDEKSAREEARCLADDPRDTIVSICLWSNYKEQFVGSVRSSLVKGEWPHFRR